MSGTSCDGMSAAIARFHHQHFELLAEQTTPYPALITGLLKQARTLPVALAAQLNTALGELSAALVVQLLKQTHIAARRVAVIGLHGHTFYHGPSDVFACTLQLDNPSIVAQRTGIPVIYNFRQKDIAAGGQGAPLIPFFDQFFFGNSIPTAMQNIGGISNVTLVGRGIEPIAFDTGPGNCLLDLLAQRITHGKQSQDTAGHLAQQGVVNPVWLKQLLAHAYFRRRPPKSTGVELFNEGFLDAQLGEEWRWKLLDALATLTSLSAHCIALGYRRWLPQQPQRVIVSGGGVYNRTLMQQLRELLAPIPVVPIDEYGLPAQAKEPVAFAFLALRAYQRKANHLPQTTGARRRCILGTCEYPT
jgi:anhydro-N-acetylmuramic acid kinase